MSLGQSVISDHLLDLDIDCIEEIFSKREPLFYKSLFQRIIEGQAGSKYPIFAVLVGNVKETGKNEYTPEAPLVEHN